MNPAHIESLLQLNIGQINDMEKHRQQSDDKWRDIIDRQRETVASAIEHEKINKNWAKDFLEEFR